MGDKSPAKGTDETGKPTKQKRERRNDDKKDSKQTEEAMPPEPTKGRRNRGTVGERGNDGDSGGWMSSGNSTGKSFKAKINFEPDDDAKDAPLTNMNKDKHFRDDNEEVMIIPDLDEEGGADADTRIAHAPRNVNRKIPTLAELEYEVKVALPNSADGYNLSILLNTLVPAAMVYEPDVPWTFESLLREVTDELTHIPKTVVNAPSIAAAAAAGGGAGATTGLSPAAAVKPTNPSKAPSSNLGGGGGGDFTKPKSQQQKK